jgi:hypothetical protein
VPVPLWLSELKYIWSRFKRRSILFVELHWHGVGLDYAEAGTDIT